VLSLVVPGGVSYWKGEQDDASHTRQVQRSLLDIARDSSNSGWARLGAGVGAILEQPGAVLNDIARAITKVPGQLWAAGGDVGEAFQAESLTGAAYELTEAVEKTAGAAETVVGTAVLVRGAARARVVEEGRTAGRTRTAPAEGNARARTADPPTDLYDGAAWDAYYRAHPELQRSVGAAGARGTGATRGVVYKRTDPKTGEGYVGKAKSPQRFDARQGEHNRKLGVEHEYEVLGRAEPGEALSVLEETRIREHGGLQKEGGSLVNKRHEMREPRYRRGGGAVDDPNR
jgi:hypothetical protein